MPRPLSELYRMAEPLPSPPAPPSLPTDDPDADPEAIDRDWRYAEVQIKRCRIVGCVNLALTGDICGRCEEEIDASLAAAKKNAEKEAARDNRNGWRFVAFVVLLLLFLWGRGEIQAVYGWWRFGR